MLPGSENSRIDIKSSRSYEMYLAVFEANGMEVALEQPTEK